MLRNYLIIILRSYGILNLGSFLLRIVYIVRYESAGNGFDQRIFISRMEGNLVYVPSAIRRFAPCAMGNGIRLGVVHRLHTRNTPMSSHVGTAAEFWLLLIDLGGSMRDFGDCIGSVKTRDNRETLEDFGESCLINKLQKLLGNCEDLLDDGPNSIR